MKDLHFIIPGDINTLAGGYVYDKMILEGLRRKGHIVSVHELDADFPFPSSDSLIRCKHVFKTIPAGDPILIDSLIFGSIPDILGDLHAKNPIVAIIHLPLSKNPNYSPSIQAQLARQEKVAFRYTDKVVAVSDFTKQLLAEYNVDPSIIKVINPGVSAVSQKTDFPGCPEKLLCVGSYLPGKGQILLVEALAKIKSLPWTLNMYGIKEFDRAYVQNILTKIKIEGLSDRIFMNSPVSNEELHNCYLNADLFILPTYFENFCMSLNDALAHGLPVITTNGSGIPYSVPGNMGLFVRHGNVPELSDAIRKLLTDPIIYKEIYTNASQYCKSAKTWIDAINQFHALIFEFQSSSI
jgi:glycosyltransferase involved in cell wall biosynthesis